MNNEMSKTLMHHGIPGQKWGKRNGPPYPLSPEISRQVRISRAHTNRENPDVKYTRKNSSLIAGQPPPEKLEDLQRKQTDFSILEDCMEVNNINERSRQGRVFNCQNCSVAYEMRRRGYDVAARLMDDGSNVFSPEKRFKDGKFTLVDVKDLEKSYPKSDDFNEDPRAAFAKARSIAEEGFSRFATTLSHEPPGSRGIAVVGWLRNAVDIGNRTSYYHAFNYEIGKDGKPTLLDCEGIRHKDEAIQNVSRTYTHTIDFREYSYMRTDNLELDPSVTEAVISRKLVKKLDT